MTDATPERWAPIPGYEGHYEASDLGRIRSLDRILADKNGRRVQHWGRVLKPSPVGTSRYLAVQLWSGNTRQPKYVHALVLLTFDKPRPEGMECCHGNGDKHDNRLVNLRWDTHPENMEEFRRHRAERGARCPHGHLLAEPNLTKAGRRGYRRCLACRNASNYATYSRRIGRSYDFQAVAGRHYERIMAGAEAA